MLHILLDRATERPPPSPADFDNHGSRLLVTGITLMSITLLIMSGRIYCRAILLKRMGSDDWCMIFATLAALPLLIANCIAVSVGTGRHSWTLTIEAKQTTKMLGYISMMHYFIALGFTKASLLLFLIRLAPATKISRASWYILAFVVAYTIIAFILSAVQCVPASYLWESTSPSALPNPKAYCLSQVPLNYTLFPINILTDLIIWLLPLKMIWNVQMPPRQKGALFIIFSFGSMSVLAGILRLKSVKDSLDSVDPTWDNLELGIWSIVEVLVGIICGSAPAVKPLLSKFLPSVLGSSSFKSDSSSRRAPRPFPDVRSRPYALGSIDPNSHTSEGNSSQEEFGPQTRIEGRGIKTGSDNESEDFNPEQELGILKSTEVQIRFEERV